MLSFWEKQSFLSYDHIIIGGGIVGLSTAAELLETNRQLRVLVLERGLFPSGASTKNAGFACFGSLTELLLDIQKLGPDGCLALVEKRWEGLRKLRERLGDRDIDFHQYGGYELIRQQELPALDSMKEVNDLLYPMFKTTVFEEQRHKIKEFGFGPSVETVVYNPLEGQIDTGQMMQRLLAYCRLLGADILTGAEVASFSEEASGVRVQVKSPGDTGLVVFRCRHLAICTNAFTRTLLPDIDLQPGRGQVLVTSPIPDLRFKGTFHMDEGYFYFRNFGQRVIFGGGRHLDLDTETTTEFGHNLRIADTLMAHLHDLILPGQAFEVEHQWSGIMAFGPVKEPILRKYSSRIALGVRLGGMGVAIGSKVAEQLAQWMLED
jgi:glycine/D-amino acid oxidase-like deaminating enzyme